MDIFFEVGNGRRDSNAFLAVVGVVEELKFGATGCHSEEIWVEVKSTLKNKSGRLGSGKSSKAEHTVYTSP